jgi:hypothetical protein
VPIGASTDTTIVTVVTTGSDRHRKAGTAILRSGSTLVQVDFHVIADLGPSTGGCFIYGTATRAT